MKQKDHMWPVYSAGLDASAGVHSRQEVRHVTDPGNSSYWLWPISEAFCGGAPISKDGAVESCYWVFLRLAENSTITTGHVVRFHGQTASKVGWFSCATVRVGRMQRSIRWRDEVHICV